MFWRRKPKFEPETYRMAFIHVIDILSQYCPIEKIRYRDMNYLVPVNPAYVMRSIPVDMKINKDNHEGSDCDDYVRVFRGELSKMGWGNLLAMDVSLDVPGNTTPHATIGFLQCGKLVFGEWGRMIHINYEKVNFITL